MNNSQRREVTPKSIEQDQLDIRLTLKELSITFNKFKDGRLGLNEMTSKSSGKPAIVTVKAQGNGGALITCLGLSVETSTCAPTTNPAAMREQIDYVLSFN